MYHAKDSDFDRVKSLFSQNREWFGHVGTGSMRTAILNNSIKFNFKSNFERKWNSSALMIYEDDVLITYNIYKVNRKLGNYDVKKGDCVLYQIGAKNRDGSGSRILNKFFEYVNTKVILTVRQNNTHAKKFYEKNNMKIVGETSWSKGTILGDIYATS
tara:strand:+ start:1553 stop:2026 length:474 start_codon:yes stop_codon:yes gene_type:complete